MTREEAEAGAILLGLVLLAFVLGLLCGANWL